VTSSLGLRAGLLSLLLLGVLLGVWQLATQQPAAVPAPAAAAVALTPEQIEYAKLMGKDPASLAGGGGGAAATPTQKSGFPTPGQLGAVLLKHLVHPFYDNGPNDKGLGLQLGERPAAPN
jgi:nitrate/nitrite transport system permease protein